MATILPEK